MILRKWEDLPEKMRTEAVRPYYEILRRKRFRIGLCRAADAAASALLLILLLPLFAGISAAILLDDGGPVLFRQERVTRYGRRFRIFKFRTMRRRGAEDQIRLTRAKDGRITRTGRWLRKMRLDELPQLLNVLRGDMALVGTRPEVPEYVARYADEMRATLLLPAGITSEASIAFRNESEKLEAAEDAEKAYLREILPAKMRINLAELRQFGVRRNLRTMLKTAAAMSRKDRTEESGIIGEKTEPGIDPAGRERSQRLEEKPGNDRNGGHHRAE